MARRASKTNSVGTIQRAILKWYRAHARVLPWRGLRDPYHIWLSEIMLQQTRVDTVIPYFERFVRELPTVHDLAGATQDRVFKLWEGLGYYSRARNLHAAAKIIANERHGEFPRTAEEWRELPGVGRYTAAAIASIACDEPAAALDGNIKRVLARLFAVDGDIGTPAVQVKLWELAETLLPHDAAGEFNQALMDLGATVCVPANPRCATCPVRAQCAARAAGRQDELPVKAKKGASPIVHAAAVLLRDEDDRILLVKRGGKRLLAGLWELPNAEGADAATARREITRQLNLNGTRLRRLGEVEHVFTHRRWRMRTFATAIINGNLPQLQYDETIWVAHGHIKRYALSRLHQKAIALLTTTKVLNGLTIGR